jgi:ABC-type molybdenum transport system ATPase subunit/photorepair protein PhrA
LSDASTLEAKAARIDLLGQPLLARLDVTSQAERVALLGDWSALFRLLAGEAELSAGSLTVGGVAVPQGVARGTIGLMRYDPLLPPSWSAEQLLSTSAELSGMPAAIAGRLAFQTLERLGLVELASRRLAHLPPAERRALLVAHAVLTDPRVLCLEEPLAGLDTHAEHTLLAVIERAAAGRRLLVSLADPEQSANTRRLLQSCTDRFGLAAGVAVALPARSAAISRVTATVCKNHQAFAAALAARGLRAHATHEAGMLNTLTSPQAGPCWRYLVELSSDNTSPVLDAALETEAGLVELIPLFS